MKLICIFAHLLLFQPVTDSVDLRVYNDSKYYITKYSLMINHTGFNYDSIPPHTFSKYKKVPYVYAANESKCVYILKTFLGRSKTITVHTYPVDHIKDKRLENGKATLLLAVVKSKKNINILTSLKRDYK